MSATRIAVICAALLAAACGPSKGPTGPDAPPAYLPGERTCPGAFVGDNVQVTSAVGESNAPVVAWTGDGFSLAWWDLRGRSEIYTTRVDKEGLPLSATEKLPSQEEARGHSLAYDGRELHAVWSEERSVVSLRIGSGEPARQVLSTSGEMAVAGPFGAAVWVDKGRLLFRCDGMLPPPDDQGRRPEPEPAVIGGGGIEDPQIAWNGEMFAVVWSGSVPGGREILLQRVNPKGQRLGLPVKVSAVAGTSRKPQVVWAGDGFGVAWTNAAPEGENPRDRYRVFFAVVPARGAAPRMTRQLEFNGAADQVALASSGKEFALAWMGSRADGGSSIFLRRIGADGGALETTVEVTDGVPISAGRPAISWAGDGYGVAWQDDRATTGNEIFFAFVMCGEEPAGVPAPAAEAKGGPAPAQDPNAAPPDAGTQPFVENPGDVPDLKDVF